MRSHDSFDEATAAAGPEDMVCGTLLKSGEPAYFLMPRGSDQESVRDVAFQVRHGRPMQSYERFLLGKAEQLRAAEPEGQPA